MTHAQPLTRRAGARSGSRTHIPRILCKGVGTGWCSVVPAVISLPASCRVIPALIDWCLRRLLCHPRCVVRVSGRSACYSRPTALASPTYTPPHKRLRLSLLWLLLPVVARVLVWPASVGRHKVVTYVRNRTCFRINNDDETYLLHWKSSGPLGTRVTSIDT